MDLLPPNSICDTELVVRIKETGIPTFEFLDLPGTVFQHSHHICSVNLPSIVSMC